MTEQKQHAAAVILRKLSPPNDPLIALGGPDSLPTLAILAVSWNRIDRGQRRAGPGTTDLLHQ